MTKPTAVYRHYSDSGVLLYVGIASDPDERWKKHRAAQPDWTAYGALRTDKWYATRELAEAGERWVIRTERPLFNRRHSRRPLATTYGDPVFGTRSGPQRTLVLANGSRVRFELVRALWTLRDVMPALSAEDYWIGGGL